MTRFGLLGTLQVLDEGGVPVDLGGRQPRVVLAALLAASGRVVTPGALADAVWGERPPESATGTLQSYVSRLRRRIGGWGAIVHDEWGYRLDVAASEVDFRRFEDLAAAGRAQLAAGRPQEARERLVEAEALWRGPALAEFADLDFAAGLATRLEQLRLAALEDRVGADLALGRHGAVAGELAELVAAHPLREGLRAHLALALYRSGRQAEALRALADAARALREELGIDPGRPLRELEAAILAQDPALDLPAGPGSRPAPVAVTPAAAVVPPAQPRLPLVGREAELAHLVAAFEESAVDNRFVVVEGEPGIGKTRLAEELRALAAARGALAVWGRTDEGGAAPALWPWLPPLREMAGDTPDLPRALADILGGEVPMLAGQAAAAQFERFAAVAALADAVARRRPLVVLLDDLQWADTASLELLAFLAGRAGRGMTVVATLRQLEVGRHDAITDALAAVARRAGSRRLVLRGLAEPATVAVLEASTGGGLAAPLAAAIHARAEGNPFYAIELSRLAGEEGGLGREVPGTVGDVVRRRLARLPPPTLELLEVAAVVGREAPIPRLAQAASQPVDAVADDLEPAVVHRLLVEVPERPAELRFSHALVREVLLDGMTSLRRARLHLRVADAIEAAGAGTDDAEILAEHLWRASAVGGGQRAAVALERAAEVALHRVSYQAAEELLARAVQLRRASGADPEAELAAIFRLLEVARARRYFQGATDPGIMERAKHLAERLGRRQQHLELLWFEWSALATSCQREQADPLALGLLELTAGDPDPGVRATGIEVYAVSCWEAGRITEAEAHFDTSLTLLAGAGPATSPFEVEKRLVSRTFWLWCKAATGSLPPAEIFAGFDEMVAGAHDRFGVASICGFAATTAATLGCWDEVERYVAVGLEADRESQFAFWGGQIGMLRGVVDARRGDAGGAVRRFAEGRAQYTGIGARSALATFEASLALALAADGRAEAAADAAARARAELDDRRERWNEPVVLLAEAVVAHARGDRDLAVTRAAEAATRARGQGSHAIAARVEAEAAALRIGAAGA